MRLSIRNAKNYAEHRDSINFSMDALWNLVTAIRSEVIWGLKDTDELENDLIGIAEHTRAIYKQLKKLKG